MKNARTILIINALVLLSAVLLAKWRNAQFRLDTTFQRMVEINVIDGDTSETITNCAVEMVPLPADFRTQHQQHVLARPNEGRFVLAQVGGEPLRAIIRATGYNDRQIDLGSTAFRSEPIQVKLVAK